MSIIISTSRNYMTTSIIKLCKQTSSFILVLLVHDKRNKYARIISSIKFRGNISFQNEGQKHFQINI